MKEVIEENEIEMEFDDPTLSKPVFPEDEIVNGCAVIIAFISVIFSFFIICIICY